MSSAGDLLDSLSAKLDGLVDSASRLPVLGVLVRAAVSEQRHMAMDMAASVAYFTFLSLFPLFLGLFALGGVFLESADMQARLDDFLNRALPVSSDFVTRNIESLIRLRGPAGAVSLILLMWSGSKMVGALNRGINNALGFEWSLDAYLSPLRNFGLTLTVSLVLLLTLAMAPVTEILSGLELGLFGSRGSALIDRVARQAAGIGVSTILLTAIYRLVPYQRLPWRDLLPGILVAATALEIAKRLFVLYVGSVSRFDAIYGSVSSVIVLLIWLYFSARVVLYGTEVIGVYREAREARDVELEE